MHHSEFSTDVVTELPVLKSDEFTNLLRMRWCLVAVTERENLDEFN